MRLNWLACLLTKVVKILTCSCLIIHLGSAAQWHSWKSQEKKKFKTNELTISPGLYVASSQWSFWRSQESSRHDVHTLLQKAQINFFSWVACWTLSCWWKWRMGLSSGQRCLEEHIHNEVLCWNDPGKPTRDKNRQLEFTRFYTKQ